MSSQTKNSTAIDFSALDIKKSNILEALEFDQVVAGLFIAVILMVLLSTISLDFMVLVLMVIAFAIGVVWFRESLRYGEKKAEAIRRFAEMNGLSYMESSRADFGPGSLFTHGHSKNTSLSVEGELRDLPFRLYQYNYITGSGKNQRDHQVMVMEFTLPRPMPHMVIDSLVEPGKFASSTLPIRFDDQQRIDLEGDFHKYFALYAPDTYGVTALTIIAPDTMETLMQYASVCDIEIIDNKLYFYWSDTAFSSNNYQEKFQTAQAVLDQISHKLTRSDVFARESQAQLHSYSATGRGARLKKVSWNMIIVLVGTLFVIQWLSVFFAPSLPDLTGLLIWLVLGWFGWRYYRHQQLRKSLAVRVAEIDNSRK